MNPISNAPKDETFILLRVDGAESGWIIGFWSTNAGDWFESEASSHSIASLYGEPRSWAPLPAAAQTPNDAPPA